MARSSIPAPKPFKLDNHRNLERFEEWIDEFSDYAVCTSLYNDTQIVQLAHFRSLMGPEMRPLMKQIKIDDISSDVIKGAQCPKLEHLIAGLKEKFDVKKNILFEIRIL